MLINLTGLLECERDNQRSFLFLSFFFYLYSLRCYRFRKNICPCLTFNMTTIFVFNASEPFFEIRPEWYPFVFTDERQRYKTSQHKCEMCHQLSSITVAIKVKCFFFSANKQKTCPNLQCEPLFYHGSNYDK